MHYHNHNEGSDLQIQKSDPGTAFRTGIIINVAFIAIEIFYGFMSNSMALVSDAGHNLSDVLALTFSWIALSLSKSKPTQKFTYGLRRSTILVALFNSVLLVGAVIFIVYENIIRINNPVVINSGNVVTVASAGIAVNGFTAWLFMKGRHDLNIRSAFLHFLADTLVSLGVVIAGVIMRFTGLHWIDTMVSFTIVLVILYSSYKLLTESLNLALDAVPSDIDINAVRRFLLSLPEVSDVHDLHIWAMSTTENALTAHLTTSKQTDMEFMNFVTAQLQERFGLGHTTIQIEFGQTGSDCSTNCL